ncbi:MAG: hypothetical protein HYU75_23605 [Betaproteobacteria bacterium]|nr:hypothetical protein [Betaproteobacteria bacterium]
MNNIHPAAETPAPPAHDRIVSRSTAWRWFDENILELGRELRLSYLPPLMVYMAAGISGLTGIVGTFFVKEYLGLSAAFLAALGFWAGIPWALKMPLGHLVDLIWRWKSWLVYFGAGLIAASLFIMVGLIAEVPRIDENGRPIDPEQRKLMHTTMQTLGRVAIIGGTVIVALINLYVFGGTQDLPAVEKARLYLQIYEMALVIPVISVLGVMTAAALKVRELRRLVARGMSPHEAAALLSEPGERPAPNWWILGGGLVFVLFTLAMGLSDIPFNPEVIFAGSFAIVSFLVVRLTRELEPAARETLIGTAIVIFIFRAIPSSGAGIQWWMIDVLGFDQQFFSVLSLIASALTLAGMFIFRRFMAERSIAYIVGFLTVLGTLLALPFVGMYYGLHEWTARVTGGVVDARFIALVDTALESPLGQIAMIPMLAWIARCAPSNLKATYFAVMASFTNLALSLSQLGTKYLNQVFTVTREVKDPVSRVIEVPADYSQLGELLIAQVVIGLALPFAAILFARFSQFRSA